MEELSIGARIDIASEKLSKAWAEAVKSAGMSVVQSEAEMLPGDGDCRRYAGPYDASGVCPLVVSDETFIAHDAVVNQLSRDLATWVNGLAAGGLKTITYSQPPTVRVCSPDVQAHTKLKGAPCTNLIWMLYAAVA